MPTTGDPACPPSRRRARRRGLRARGPRAARPGRRRAAGAERVHERRPVHARAHERCEVLRAAVRDRARRCWAARWARSWGRASWSCTRRAGASTRWSAATRRCEVAASGGRAAERAAGRFGDAGVDRLGGVDRHRSVREGETVFVSRRRGRRGLRRGPDRQGARVPGDRQRRRAGEGRLRARRARLRRRASTTGPSGSRRRSTSTSTTSAGPSSRRAIGELRRGGRIALCGAVSQYNAVEPSPGPRNLALLVGKRGMMRGFIVGDHADRDPEFRAEVGDLIGVRPAEARRDGGRRRARGGAASVRRHAARAAPGQGGRRAVKRSAGVLLRRGSRARSCSCIRAGRSGRRRMLGAWSIPKGEYADGRGPRGGARREFARGARRRGAGRAGRPRLGSAEEPQGGPRVPRRRATSTSPRSSATRSRWSGHRGPAGWPSFPEIDRAEWFTSRPRARSSTPHRPSSSTG